MNVDTRRISSHAGKRVSEAFLVTGLVDPQLGYWHSTYRPSLTSQKPKMEQPETKEKESHPGIIYCLTITATLSGLLFGYDTAIINGAILMIGMDYELSKDWSARIIAATIGSAAVFSLFSGVVADAIGRKSTIIVSAIIFTVGGFIMGFANGITVIFIGRLTVGAAVGFVSSVVPIYISECAPPAIRGLLITMNQLFITIGIVLSTVAAGGFQSFEHGWRLMLGLSVIPAIVQIILLLGLPESPRYQMMKNQEAKAEKTLRKIRKKDDVSEELKEMRRSLEEEKGSKGWEIWKRIFATPHVRKALIYGCMLQVFQQFCGINIVIYYSSTILVNAGFSAKLAIWLAVIPATINFLSTFIGLWAVESLGRKLVLALSFLAIAASLLVLSTAFLLGQINSPPAMSIHEGPNFVSHCTKYSTCHTCTQDATCGFCYLKEGNTAKAGSCVNVSKDETTSAGQGRCEKVNGTDVFMVPDAYFYNDMCPSEYGWIAVLGMVFFVLGFAPGAGPMPWTINAEIYPQWSRSVANSLATVANWVSNVILSYYFLTLLKVFTAWGTFLIFCGVCVVAAIFVLLLIPETKDKSLEDTELLFMSAAVREETIQKRQKKLQQVGEPGEQAGGENVDESYQPTFGPGKSDSTALG